VVGYWGAWKLELPSKKDRVEGWVEEDSAYLISFA
jgi:hypothetical protein